MKKFTNVKLGGVILTLLLLALVSGNVWGQEVTEAIDFTSQGFGNAQKITNVQGENVACVFDQAEGSTPPAYYSNGNAARLYAKNTLEVSAPGEITEVVFTFSDKNNKPTGNPASEGDYSNDRWTGSVMNKVVFTNPNTKGHWRIQKISVTYRMVEATQVSAPVFTPTDATSFVDKLTVTATCSTDGATIHYTKDGTEPTTSSDVFPTEGVTLTETTTLKAIAVKDGLDNSEVVTATYTKLEPYADIAALKAAGIATVDGVDCVVKLTDAVVTYAEARKAYIQDATAGLCIYGDNTLKAGTTLNGVVQAKLKLYNGLNQLVVSGGEFDKVTVGEGAAIPETEVTLAELNQNFAKYESMRVKVVDATVTSAFTSQNGEISQGGSTMALRAADTGIQVDVQATVDVVGYPGLHNTTPQLNVLQQEDIAVKTAGKKEATLSFEQEVYTVNVGEMVTVKAVTNSTAPVVYSTDAQDVVLDGNTGELLVGDTPGTVTITATVAENEEFTAATATCTVNIVDPASQPKPQALVAKSKGLYYVMKAEEGSAKNSLAAEQVEILNNRVVNVGLQNILWNISEDKTIITTPDGKYLTGKDGETDLTIETVKFTWTWSEADKAWLNGNRSFVYSTSGYFKHYATSNIGKSGYADGYTVAMPIVDGYVRNVASGDYGTICLPYTVAAEDMVGADFFSVAGKVMKEGQPQSIVLEQVTTLEAGVPYIFSATSDKLIVAYNGKAVVVAGGANGLMGSFEGQDVSEGMYLLTNNTVKKVGSAGGHIGANRAYFNMDEMPEYIGTVGVNQRVISLDDVTGIDGVEAGNPKMVDVYTLSGIKVKSQVPFAEATQGLAKGIYVVNAKKVVVE